jgi:hypothetical protein
MTNWNKTDSMAYVMFYAAKADQVITADERELINSKFDATTLSRIEAEINDDNDYQRLEKIDAYVKSNNCTEGKVENLLSEIKAVFESDGNFDRLERTTFKFLEKALKAKQRSTNLMTPHYNVTYRKKVNQLVDKFYTVFASRTPRSN